MSIKFVHYSTLLLFVVIFGCSHSPKFNTEGVDKTLSPQLANENESQLDGKRVLWGGVIASSTNLKDSTQIEVIAYPLRRNAKLDFSRGPIGRFLIRQPGYLEVEHYAPGRHVSIVGLVESIETGKIGEFEQRYPVVVPETLHLWPKRNQQENGVRFGFGLSIGL